MAFGDARLRHEFTGTPRSIFVAERCCLYYKRRMEWKIEKLGSYRIEMECGRGGMSVVYSAVHDSLRTRHAVKVFDVSDGAAADVLRGKFLAEARVLATLRHSGIVRVTDYGTTDDGRPWLAMDFVEGTTLAARLAEPVPPTEGEARSLYTDIRSALAYCHSRGIVHGDLKAENVLLREDGSAVLSDFGISRITDGRMRQSLELTGSCEAGGFGTAYALAPECRDGALATSASDIYSFGVLLFKVVTGIWYDGSERMLGNLKVFAPKWSALFGLMLQRDPARRPATAAELPDDPLGCRFGSVAHLRGRYGRYALVAASFAVCIIFLAIARTVGRRDLTPPNISWPQAVSRADALGVRDGVIAPYQDDVKLPAGRVSMSKTAHFNRLNLPADGIVSIEIPGDFSGTLLTADEVDGELREQVRVVPQPGMRVLYRGNREVVVKRQ